MRFNKKRIENKNLKTKDAIHEVEKKFVKLYDDHFNLSKYLFDLNFDSDKDLIKVNKDLDRIQKKLINSF